MGYLPPGPGTGYPPPHLDLGWGTPCVGWMGYPLPGTGYPPPGTGYPSHLDLGQGTPPPRPGMGYPLCWLDGVPPAWAWDRVSPTWDRVPLPPGPGTGYLPTPKCEQTDTCENTTFPRTSYAGGNKSNEASRTGSHNNPRALLIPKY